MVVARRWRTAAEFRFCFGDRPRGPVDGLDVGGERIIWGVLGLRGAVVPLKLVWSLTFTTSISLPQTLQVRLSVGLLLLYFVVSKIGCENWMR